MQAWQIRRYGKESKSGPLGPLIAYLTLNDFGILDVMLHPLANAVAVAGEVVALLLHLLQFLFTGGYEFQHLGIARGECLVVTLVAVEHLEDAREYLVDALS